MTLIIYDSTGAILTVQDGNYVSPEGELKFVEKDIPDGYIVKSVDPETKEPVLKEIPKTEEQQKLADLEAKQAEDDERYIDQEYRLTLLELGLDDTETAPDSNGQ